MTGKLQLTLVCAVSFNSFFLFFFQQGLVKSVGSLLDELKLDANLVFQYNICLYKQDSHIIISVRKRSFTSIKACISCRKPSLKQDEHASIKCNKITHNLTVNRSCLQASYNEITLQVLIRNVLHPVLD